MMNAMNTNLIQSTSAPLPPKKSGLGALDQGDFLRLMTEQLKMQDPLDPVDNKEMLAQMAQFSSLSGIAEMGDTLKAISRKLDAVTLTNTKPSA